MRDGLLDNGLLGMDCLNDDKWNIVPLYTNGIENVAWVNGICTNGTLTKQSTYLQVQGATSSCTAFVTNTVIPINFKKLYVDWEVVSASGNQCTDFMVSTVKMDSSFVSRMQIGAGVFVRRIDLIDVSALSGSYYIKVMAEDADGSSMTIKVYHVWGE
jgi:hypothetical protein